MTENVYYLLTVGGKTYAIPSWAPAIVLTRAMTRYEVLKQTGPIPAGMPILPVDF